jgi:environmental stress-induced protein Ves
VKLTPLPAAARIATPWKNGGGFTREVAASPPGAGMGDFDWRVSIADVEASGPFSIFPGVDRVLTVLSGAMRLRIEGRPPVLLTPEYGPFAFPGDVACQSEVLSPVTDLNLMVRRGTPARVVAVEGPNVTLGGLSLVVATTPARLGDLALEPLDAVRIDGAGELAFEGRGWRIDLEDWSG